LSVGVGATTITGWEVFNNPLDWIGYLWPASDGTNSVDLDGSFTSGIRQTFATTPGQTYVVTFDMGGNLSGAPVIKPLRVSADGQSAQFYVDTTGYDAMIYVQKSWSFVADDASATLEFRSLTDDPVENPGGVQAYGAVIDNVSASAVPAPAAFWLLGTAIAGVAGMACRRRPTAGP
jgi:choice-of-anchor C domain-containing protein